LAKKWLFWFCEALACVSGKTKCAILCGWHFGSFFCRFNVALSVVIGLPLTVGSYKKLAIFTTNVDAENQTFVYHKTVCGVPNRQFLVGAVIASVFFFVRWFFGRFGCAVGQPAYSGDIVPPIPVI
jgi:hypothetical protein